jgi:hypothetical protein
MRYSAMAIAVFFTLLSGVPVSATEVNVRGTVKDNSSNALSGATAILINAGLSATTNSGGEFAVTGTIQTIGTKFNGKLQNPSISGPRMSGSQLLFTIPSQPRQVRIDIFDIKGRLIRTALNDRLSEGSYAISPVHTLQGRPSSMTYLVRIRIDRETAAFMVPHTGGVRFGHSGLARVIDPSNLNKYAAGAVDTLEITLCGYVLSRRPVESYSQSGITMTMAQSTLETATERSIDSLFDALRDLIGSLDSIDGPEQLKSKDFASLRDGFDEVLSSKDSYHMKANIGYVVSSVLALNTNESFWMLVDSLDAYFTAVDSTTGASLPRPLAKSGKVMRKALARGGVTGLGKSMAAVSWSALALSNTDPSFPKFITLAYIQSIAENDVLPVLNNVVAACGRMETCGDRSLFLEIEGDTFEIDKGEVHLLDAQMRLLRAGLNSFCMYETDIYAPGTTDNSWIDSLRHMESTSGYIYSLSGDTLKTVYMRDDATASSFMARLIKYNMTRNGFLTQRRANGLMVKNDLLAIPKTIKTGIAYIRDEKDNQSNDILKIADLMNADRDLVDVPQQMIDDGVSPALANKFRSPESIADFVTEILTGPYTFDEMTTDSVRINLTVNLTAMLDSPVYDLRTLLPKYAWLPDSEWVVHSEDNNSLWADNGSMVYVYPEDSLAIPASAIDEIDSSSGFYRVVYLKSEYNQTRYIDSSVTIIPICLIDDAGSRIAFEDIPDMVESKTFFPYFNDYTMGGVFPGMTRQKWLDLIYQE